MTAFEIDVFSEPLSALNLRQDFTRDQIASLLTYDSNLIKPALLFSEKVYLHSYREDMRIFHEGRIAEQTYMPLRMFLYYVEFVRKGDRSEFDEAGLAADEIMSDAEVRAVDATRHAKRSDLDQFSEIFFNLTDKYEIAVVKVARYRKRRLSEWLEPLDASSLDPAISAGILEVLPWNLETTVRRVAFYPEEEYFDQSVDHLFSKLASPERATMFDPGTDEMLGFHASSDLAQKLKALNVPAGAVETHIANAVCGHLPKLSHLTIQEIVDLRNSLDKYLPAFRQEMARLADEIASDSSDPGSVAKEVERRWVRDIDPVLTEIRQQVTRGSYPRHLLRALAKEKDVIVSTASSVVLAAGSVAAGVATLLPAIAAAGYPAVKAANDFLSTRDEVRQNRLYFLHAARDQVEHSRPRRRRK